MLIELGAQSRSTARSDSYQTMLMRPASPAASHGQNSMWPLGPYAPVCTVFTDDHVRPSSREYAYMIELGVACSVLASPPVSVLGQPCPPPFVPLGAVSQT